jgi:hypothetical protein
VQAGAIYEQELCIRAHRSELRRVRNFAAAVSAHCGFDRARRFSAMAAVHEAVAAQLQTEGGLRDSVSVRALWSGGSLTFWVRSKLQLERGLGTQVMRLLARDVSIQANPGGTTVRITL